MRSERPGRAIVLLVALVAIAAACGGGDDELSGELGELVGVGEVVISGSSTVEPISVAVAEAYRSVDGDLDIAVLGPGTGDGFKAFCDGGIDISDASRPIKDSEAMTCAENEIEYLELKVGIDGIAVITSADNTAVECLSFGDLYGLVGPESAGFTSWSDANDLAVEAGGSGSLPDTDLVISAPGTESGTYDSFIEIALSDIATDRGQEPTTRPDYSSAADDNVIIETISSNPSAFGWVGFAFAEEATDVTLLPVSVEAGSECIAPTAETIASSEYPISRDLYIYVNTNHAGYDPAMAAFVDYYLDYGLDTAVAEAGYVPLTDEAKTATRELWESR